MNVRYEPNANDQWFRDRREAGEQLARSLAPYRGNDVLVLGIPRGGVPVAAAVARGLEAELDVVVARKIGAPHQPELAIGAVTANGGLFLDAAAVAELAVPDRYLATEIASQRVLDEDEELNRQRLVETEIVPDLFELGIGRFGLCHGDRRIARQEAHEQEDEDHHQQEGGDDLQQPRQKIGK